eukprot:COSAG01_NODE_1418_length_10375_cov_38.842254_16_plen_115_part_01
MRFLVLRTEAVTEISLRFDSCHRRSASADPPSALGGGGGGGGGGLAPPHPAPPTALGPAGPRDPPPQKWIKGTGGVVRNPLALYTLTESSSACCPSVPPPPPTPFPYTGSRCESC